MRRIHLTVGVVILLAFAYTGRVMRTQSPPMRDLSDGERLMYRSRHIYILGSGVANVLLGLYFAPRRSVARRVFQYGGSVLFLAAPVFLALAFFAEPGHGLAAPMWRSHLGLFALLGGTILHLLAAERAGHTAEA